MSRGPAPGPVSRGLPLVPFRLPYTNTAKRNGPRTGYRLKARIHQRLNVSRRNRTESSKVVGKSIAGVNRRGHFSRRTATTTTTAVLARGRERAHLSPDSRILLRSSGQVESRASFECELTGRRRVASPSSSLFPSRY